MTIDTNAHLGHWPFRRHGFEETAKFLDKLRAVKVTEAWVGSFECVLHKDVAGANARLAAECRDHRAGMLLPFGTVNPMLPDWREDLRRCVEVHRMPGLRLHPNYHGYKLDDPAFRDKFLTPNFIFPIVSPPEAFADRIRRESEKWGTVIRDANIKVE